MKTLTINEKINSRSNTHRFRVDIKNLGASAFYRLYEGVSRSKIAYGNYGGGVWEVPAHRIWDEQLIHLTPRIAPD